MKMRNRILVAAAALAAVVLSGSLTGCKKLEARDNLNKGVAAFKNAKYPDAVQFFTKAVDLDPDLRHGPVVSRHGVHEPIHPGRRVARERRNGQERAGQLPEGA